MEVMIRYGPEAGNRFFLMKDEVTNAPYTHFRPPGSFPLGLSQATEVVPVEATINCPSPTRTGAYPNQFVGQSQTQRVRNE